MLQSVPEIGRRTLPVSTPPHPAPVGSPGAKRRKIRKKTEVQNGPPGPLWWSVQKMPLLALTVGQIGLGGPFSASGTSTIV